MAKKKLNILGIVLIAVAVVGIVLAIVGIAIPWFTTQTKTLVGDNAKTYGLFAEKLDGDFPIAVVQAFAIISLILAAAACTLLALNTFGLVKVKWLYRAILAGLVVVCAILTLVFAIVFANQYGGAGISGVASVEFVTSAGSYLLPIGAILAGLPLLVGRK